MKFEIELHPNFVSDIVVKQLQEMYEHTKEDYFDTDPVEAQAAIALVLDYFMPPSDYKVWEATHRSLVDECVEGFDQLEKEREWVGLSDEDLGEIIEAWHEDDSLCSTELCDMIEAKLKELNT